MLKSFENMNWDDIYSYWQMSTEEHMSIVNKAPLPCKIEVKGNSKNRIYSYLWLKKDQIYNIKNKMNQMVDVPIYRQNLALTDERIMRAADLMIQSKSEEERMAIWLWIFCSSLEKAQLPYPNSKYIELVGAKARLFLEESFQEWIFRYHHRFPLLFVDAKKLSKVKFERYSIIIDFAIMNAYMLCKEYSIVLFDSEPEKKEPPFSYRDLRKE